MNCRMTFGQKSSTSIEYTVPVLAVKPTLDLSDFLCFFVCIFSPHVYRFSAMFSIIISCDVCRVVRSKVKIIKCTA